MSKIIVACKLPQGFNPETVMNVPATGQDPTPVIFEGSNQDGADRTGGYGITDNVDADSYGKWAKSHSDMTAIKKGLIFTGTDLDAVRDRAREQGELRHGFEAVDPETHGVKTDVDAMKSGDEAQKELARQASAKK